MIESLDIVYHSKYFHVIFCMCDDNIVVDANTGMHYKYSNENGE